LQFLEAAGLEYFRAGKQIADRFLQRPTKERMVVGNDKAVRGGRVLDVVFPEAVRLMVLRRNVATHKTLGLYDKSRRARFCLHVPRASPWESDETGDFGVQKSVIISAYYRRL
jgi:hypothetical protein